MTFEEGGFSEVARKEKDILEIPLPINITGKIFNSVKSIVKRGYLKLVHLHNRRQMKKIF